MEEKLGKFIGPGFVVLIQIMFLLTTLGNQTEWWYILDQHSSLNNIILFWGIHASLVVSYLTSITIDSAILAFGVIAMRNYQTSRTFRSVIPPLLGVLIMSGLSALANYQMTASIHLTEFDGLYIFGVATNTINPYIPALMPFGNFGLTIMTPWLFPKANAMTKEEFESFMEKKRQEALIKEMDAKTSAKVWETRAGGLVNAAKQTGIGKKLADRLEAGSDESGPQMPEETLEEQSMPLFTVVTATPEWVGTTEFVTLYNRHRGALDKVDDRKVRQWADNGKIPGEKLDGRTWSFDLNVLAQHPNFKTIIARHRRAEEKKKFGAKAPASRPVPNVTEVTTDSGPLAPIQGPIARAMEQTPPPVRW